MTGYFHKNFQ